MICSRCTSLFDWLIVFKDVLQLSSCGQLLSLLISSLLLSRLSDVFPHYSTLTSLLTHLSQLNKWERIFLWILEVFNITCFNHIIPSILIILFSQLSKKTLSQIWLKLHVMLKKSESYKGGTFYDNCWLIYDNFYVLLHLQKL